MMHLPTVLPSIFRRPSVPVVKWDSSRKDVSVGLQFVLSGLKAPTEADWKRRIEVIELYLSEMQKTQAYRSNPEIVQRAILNLRAMLVAMKQRDLLMTRQMGKAALSALSRE